MPKKTRREKVIAAYRKKLKLLKQMDKPATPQLDASFAKGEPVEEPTSAPSPLKIEEKYPTSQEDTTLKTYFIKDLRKSLLLIAFIIALEIIIYFGTINHYFRL